MKFYKMDFFKLLLSLSLMLIMTTTTHAALRIETVVADVSSETALPPMVKERMDESVSAIGLQLLSGHVLPINNDWRNQQEVIIHTVFDKILVGYTVEKVSIKVLDTTAHIKVRLLPWMDTIKKIQVNTNIEGMPPELEKLVKDDLKQTDEVFSDGLNGLPIAATDWTNGILKRRLNKFMQNALPEFRADFDIKIKSDSDGTATAIIELTVYPKLPVVRTISLSMRSDTMPNIALVTHRTLMEDKVNVLVGVPVAFVERHKEDIQNILAKPLDEQTDFRVLKIKSNVNVNAAEHTSIMIRSDLKRRMILIVWLFLIL